MPENLFPRHLCNGYANDDHGKRNHGIADIIKEGHCSLWDRRVKYKNKNGKDSRDSSRIDHLFDRIFPLLFWQTSLGKSDPQRIYQNIIDQDIKGNVDHTTISKDGTQHR